LSSGSDGKVAGFGIDPVHPQTPGQRAAAFKSIDLNARVQLVSQRAAIARAQRSV
jgi:hypothetical protein